MKSIVVTTSAKTEFIDITSRIDDIARKNGWASGIIHIYIPHTTAGITINENADSSVQEDIIESLNKLAPANKSYKHCEGNSDAHIKASLIGSSVAVIVEDNKLILGRWQGIFFCEFDGPRKREIYLQFCNA